jgi:hypothetical protein
MAPSNVLNTGARLRAAAGHSSRRVAIELLNPHWLAAGASEGVRVHRMNRTFAKIDVDYPGGWRQEAEVALVWPEDVERLLEEAGLTLEVMRAAGPATDLHESSSFHVFARVREAGRLSSNAP